MAFQSSVLGLVDDAHSATTELLDDAVMRDGLPEQKRGVHPCGSHVRSADGVSQREVVNGSRLNEQFVGWCPGTESNRHAPFGARGFKFRRPVRLVATNQAVAITCK